MRAHRTGKVTVAAAVLALSTLPLSSAVAADSNTSLSLDLDSQPLEGALVELCKQGHLQLVIATGSLPSKKSVPLHGSMPLGVALDQLLKGTGLTYKLVQGQLAQQVTERRASAAMPSRRPAIRMPAGGINQ